VTEILKKTRIVPSVVKRWGGSGRGSRAGRIRGVLAALCVSYPREVERVGLVGRRNWEAKRKRRVEKGVGG